MEKRPIVHVELSAKAPKKSAKFYSDVFGWDAEYMEEYDYSTFMLSDQFGGGFAQVTDINPEGSTIVYLDSASLEDDLKTIKANGGEQIGEIADVPGMGRFVHFKDPNGTRVGLWQSTEAD